MRPITAWQDIEVIIRGRYMVITDKGTLHTFDEFQTLSLRTLLKVIKEGTWQYKFE